MSVNQIIEITCPRCEHTNTVEVWYSINAQLNPQAKEQLLNGKLNLFSCSNCDGEYLVPVDLLYHDMVNNYCVQYLPFINIEDDSFLNSFSYEGHLSLLAPGSSVDDLPDYFQNIPFVFSMDELARYIVFRDKLAHHGGS